MNFSHLAAKVLEIEEKAKTQWLDCHVTVTPDPSRYGSVFLSSTTLHKEFQSIYNELAEIYKLLIELTKENTNG